MHELSPDFENDMWICGYVDRNLKKMITSGGGDEVGENTLQVVF